jgi:hypothetical protein
MTKSRKRDDGVIEGQFTEPVASESIRSEADRDRVAERAYELYMARGGEHGQDMEDWLTAEREVSGRESRHRTER